MQTARVMRGKLLTIKRREFVVAAKRFGARLSYHSTAYPAQPALFDYGLDDAGRRLDDHHGVGAVVPCSRIPTGFSDLGTFALRRHQFHDNQPIARGLAWSRDLAHGAIRSTSSATAFEMRLTGG